MDEREPRYVEPGDEFEDFGWVYPDTDFEKACLELAGRRKRYEREAQKKRLQAIERNIGPAGKYPQEFIDHIFSWCRRMNQYRTVIVLDSLIKAIRNPDNMARFRNSQADTENRDGYDTRVTW